MSASPDLMSSRWLPVILAVPVYLWIAYSLFRERWSPRILWRRKPVSTEEEEERKRLDVSATAAATNSFGYRWAAFVVWVVVVGAVLAFTIFNTLSRK